MVIIKNERNNVSEFEEAKHRKAENKKDEK